MAKRIAALIAFGVTLAAPIAALAQRAPTTAPNPEPSSDFPYVQWPHEFTPQNTPVDQGFGHFLFWDGKTLQNVEGRTFLVTLVRRDDQGSFNEYLIRRTVEGQVARMGGLKVASGRIPSRVIGDMSSVDKQSLGAGLGDIYNDPVQVWRIHRADHDIWVQYTDNSAEASLAIVETAGK